MIDRDIRMQCLSFAIGALPEAERHDVDRVIAVAEKLVAFVGNEKPKPILVCRQDPLL